jgi:ActR/RegA family two-component response regulator
VHVNSLLVTHDPQVQDTVADVFSGIDLRLREDTTSALEVIGRSHFDGFIVDCDGMEEGKNIVAGIRNSRANHQSVIFTIVNGATSVEAATELGSNFVLGKPLEAIRLESYLRSSIQKMEAEHRRYFRYQLTLDGEVILRDGSTVAAQILNVSDGGFAMRLLDRAHLHGAVTIWFIIPGPKRTVITGSAAPCWSTEPIFGMKFVSMDDESRSAYEEWLCSMALS